MEYGYNQKWLPGRGAGRNQLPETTNGVTIDKTIIYEKPTPNL